MGDVSRLIAFDLDGTLIDSRRDLADSANQLITELGGAPLSEDAVAGMVGEGAALLVKRALDAAGLQHPPFALSRFLGIYDTRLVNHTRVYDGIMDVLQSVRRHAHLGVLTNKPTAPTERILEAFAIRDLFQSVIGGDGLHPRKPDPQGLLAMMKATGAVPERTVMVGDSAIDYQTAQRASVRCCLVSYGFGLRAFSRDQVSDGDGVVDDAEGLARWLDSWVRS
ncbi:MAG TPA: HAD-IA family hydrolase [Vicinamibacterales bacterium]|nr:HAD-IA family hydrolase [Vicinamibacterales bacterium]